ncbi:MAG: patatin-like phospholipase family protein [Desulfobacteraceae bacterium]|nr:patatin-like phospholipase family protein [Desulfobacteraceae bacterium]
MNAKENLKADAVFEGGGVKGIGLVGAVAVAEEQGYSWANVAGTSAGAIVAALLAAGYEAQELRNIMTELNYNDFKDTSFLDKIPLAGPLASVIFEKGLYEGKFCKTWMMELLDKKGVETFGDLLVKGEKDDRYRFKLRVIVSDISRGRLMVLPQDIAEFGARPEDLNVALAVRMSMSIPFFYEPVRIRNMKTGEASYIVDGGLLSNFPVWLFDSDEPEWPTFGFKLVEPGEEDQVPNTIKGPVSLLAALFSTMMQAHDARYIEDAQFVRTIPIPTLGIGTTEFDITRERSEKLYESGRKAAEDFFQTWDFTKYISKYRKQQPPNRSIRLKS